MIDTTGVRHAPCCATSEFTITSQEILPRDKRQQTEEYLHRILATFWTYLLLWKQHIWHNWTYIYFYRFHGTNVDYSMGKNHSKFGKLIKLICLSCVRRERCCMLFECSHLLCCISMVVTAHCSVWSFYCMQSEQCVCIEYSGALFVWWSGSCEWALFYWKKIKHFRVLPRIILSVVIYIIHCTWLSDRQELYES